MKDGKIIAEKTSSPLTGVEEGSWLRRMGRDCVRGLKVYSVNPLSIKINKGRLKFSDGLLYIYFMALIKIPNKKFIHFNLSSFSDCQYETLQKCRLKTQRFSDGISIIAYQYGLKLSLFSPDSFRNRPSSVHIRLCHPIR